MAGSDKPLTEMSQLGRNWKEAGMSLCLTFFMKSRQSMVLFLECGLLTESLLPFHIFIKKKGELCYILQITLEQIYVVMKNMPRSKTGTGDLAWEGSRCFTCANITLKINLINV